MTSNSVCVLRSVAGIQQYIPVEDAVLKDNETLYLGVFDSDTVKDGPSGSHNRRICLPRQAVKQIKLGCCHLGDHAPDKGWLALTGPLQYAGKQRIFILQGIYASLMAV